MLLLYILTMYIGAWLLKVHAVLLESAIDHAAELTWCAQQCIPEVA
jgi:hypothetical protein